MDAWNVASTIDITHQFMYFIKVAYNVSENCRTRQMKEWHKIKHVIKDYKPKDQRAYASKITLMWFDPSK